MFEMGGEDSAAKGYGNILRSCDLRSTARYTILEVKYLNNIIHVEANLK
jgi:hypothetical protein